MSRFADLELVFRELAELTRQGRPLPAALAAAAHDLPRTRLRQALEAVGAATAEGTPLHHAFAAHAVAFPAPIPALVAAGLESDDLPGMLAIVAEHCEAESRLRGSMREALAYPLVTLAICIVVAIATAFVATSVQDSQATADEFARVAGQTSGVWRRLWGRESASASSWLAGAYALTLAHPLRTAVVLLVLGLAAWIAVRWAVRSPACRARAARIAWWLPGVAPVYRAGVSARFLATLGRLLAAGVPIDRAAALCADLFPRTPAADTARALEAGALEGVSTGAGFGATALVPASVAWMLQGGESRGALPAALLDAAAYQRARHERLALTLKTVWAPAIQIVTGIVVFVLVLIVLTPLAATYTAMTQLVR